MGSVGNQNPWAPYDSYKDCSLGICSVYCPQWCFYVLPPPPPSDDDDDSSGPTFSPLIIAIIGILASAFLLVTYYTLITKYCTRRRDDNNNGGDVEANPHPQDQCHVSGLDESVIKSIAVCKYRKGDAGFVEGTECSVCLCEFEDDENLRLLPKCTHAFHLPCIDTWLKSHSNCPLCRANIIVNSSPPPPPPTLDVTQTELVLVIDNDDEEGVVSTENNGDEDEEEEEEEGVKHLRRSISLGTFFTQKRLLVSDQELQGDGSNSKCNGAIGRSISTGRLNFSRYDNGSNSTILL